MVGPDYHPPRTATRPHWSEPLAGGETNAAATAAEWWRNFNDAELDSLIARAVQSNLDLRVALGRVREARAQYGVASADLWPTLDTSASYARSLQSKNQPLIGSLPSFVEQQIPFENNVYQAGFDASWEIDVFGGKRRALQASSAQYAALQFSRRDVLVTLLGDVAQSYILTFWR